MSDAILAAKAENDLLALAVGHHQKGNLAEAENLYRRILAENPAHPDANHNLGVLILQTGQAREAIPLLRLALEAVPGVGQFWVSLTTALLQAGRTLEARHALEEGLRRGLSGEAVEALRRDVAAALSHDRARRLQFLRETLAVGRHAELEAAVDQALAEDPDFFEAWYFRGAALLSRGETSKAFECLTQASELLPEDAFVQGALGLAHFRLGRSKQAIACFERATALRPDWLEAWNNLGNINLDLGDFERAEACFRRAVSLDPGHAKTRYNLGNVLYRLGRLDAAEAAFHQALEAAPDYAAALSALAVIFRAKGRKHEAIASCRQALAIDPNLPEARNNLGNALADIGQLEEAGRCFRRAIDLKPDYADAHNNLGNNLKDTGRFHEAEAAYRRALSLRPLFPEAHNNLGVLLQDCGRMVEARDHYARASTLNPDFFSAHSNLLFVLNHLSAPPEQSLEKALEFGRNISRKASPYERWGCETDPERPLRVGLVSGDFYGHPVGYFLENVLAAADPNRIRFFAYAAHHRNDALTERLRATCAVWREVYGLGDAALAGLIHSDAVDVLIDLSGHTAHNRLPAFAFRPAPVQATWLGYFATTGVAEIDYLIGDPNVTPEEDAGHFSEEIARLPETYLCFTPPEEPVAPTNAPPGADGRITFGCFNNFSKVNAAVQELWADILLALPEASLFLKSRQFGDATSAEAVRKGFMQRGVSPERLRFEGATSRRSYLAAYNSVDMTLDPFPYPGGTTSVEALWMGAPVLTMAGERFVGRMGETILRNVGLSEWIAADAQDYLRKALRFARDRELLADLRRSLRGRLLASPLCDAPRFARNFEALLRRMWKARASGRLAGKPAAFPTR